MSTISATKLRNQNLTINTVGNTDDKRNNTRYRLALDGTFLMLHIDISSWILLTWPIKMRLFSKTWQFRSYASWIIIWGYFILLHILVFGCMFGLFWWTIQLKRQFKSYNWFVVNKYYSYIIAYICVWGFSRNNLSVCFAKV